MKKYFLLLSIFIQTINSFGQWTTLDILSTGRIDDVYFINDSIGWAAGGNTSGIHKTENGGKTWNLQFVSGKYLRSIEFATPTLGFCGSLDSSLFKTIDGGNTWTDISNTINPKPPGICGLAAPTENVIYGCGIWSSPAFVIKSSDGGNSWKTIDLSSYAKSLVEIHFINADTGFVSGTANPDVDGGIILYTKDGGDTWEVKYKTMVPQDRVWKIQSPDGLNYYCSIQSLPSTNNVRLIKSKDAGKTWNLDTISNSYSYIQMIGFLDTLKGWTGGNSTLFETLNGGLSWNNIILGSSYNRFFKVNDSVAYMSGNKIYKYKNQHTSTNIDALAFDDLHKLKVYPNPVKDYMNIELNIYDRTNCKLELYTIDGKLIQVIFDGKIEKGLNSFRIQTNNILSKDFYLILQTNEGLMYKRMHKIN